MVWGLKLSSGFGDYFPDGDFVGYSERLKDFFENEMPPEEQAKYGEFRGAGYVGHVVDNFRYESGTAHGDGNPFRPVAEHEWPEKYELYKTYKTLGSLFMMNSRLLAVDTDFKNAVERLEPGVHEFRSIEVVTHKGQAFPKQYHTMLIGRFLSSFDPGKSDEESWRKPSENHEYYLVRRDTKQCMSGLAFSRSAMDGAHLWRERHLSKPEIFFSDALKAEFDKSNLRLPKNSQMKEV
ncbi:imm11 family protein [Labrenzia sp. MBR-25]